MRSYHFYWRLGALLLGVLFMSQPAGAQDFLHWNLAWSDALNATGTDYASIISNANSCLKTSCPVIAAKEQTFSGDVHNYESIAIYSWPDEKDPSKAWIVKDGRKNPESKKYDGEKINVFSSRCRFLSQAYCLTGNIQYAEQYVSDVKSWFVDKQTRMNPNFDFAQIIPNAYGNRGRYYGIIEAYVMTDVIESLMLMHQKGIIDNALQKKIRKWFKRFSSWMRTSSNGQQQSLVNNNTALAYDVMMCSFYHYIGNSKRYNAIANGFYNTRLKVQILPDGAQPEELKRAKPLSYCLYNLEHVLDFCCMQYYLKGAHYYSQNRQLIDAALAFVGQTLTSVDNLNQAEKADMLQLQKKYDRLKTGFASIQ